MSCSCATGDIFVFAVMEHRENRSKPFLAFLNEDSARQRAVFENDKSWISEFGVNAVKVCDACSICTVIKIKESVK